MLQWPVSNSDVVQEVRRCNHIATAAVSQTPHFIGSQMWHAPVVKHSWPVVLSVDGAVGTLIARLGKMPVCAARVLQLLVVSEVQDIVLQPIVQQDKLYHSLFVWIVQQVRTNQEQDRLLAPHVHRAPPPPPAAIL